MRPLSVLLLGPLFFLVACAHTARDQERSSPPSSGATPLPGGPASAAEPKVAFEDADADGVADRQDACPLDPGASRGEECPTQWGYFFLRVIDEQRLPIKAVLAFQPSVNKLVSAEDGYSGVLRPGTYVLRVEAPGFKPSDITFEVVPDEKALVEVELQRLIVGGR